MDDFEKMVNGMRKAKAPDMVAGKVGDALGNLPERKTRAAGALQVEAHPGGRGRRVRQARQARQAHRARRVRPWQAVAGVEACAALLGCLVAAPAFQNGSADNPAAQLSTTSESDVLGGVFAIAPAYAQELAPGRPADPAKLVLADQGGGLMGENGCFTGLAFKVEGENIAHVSARLSQGELYRITHTAVTHDDIAAMEATGELEESDGIAHIIYGDFDNAAGEDASGFDDRCVALGAGLSEDYDPDASYGFYQPPAFYNDTLDRDDLDDKRSFWALFDSFDGAELDVTVTYSDGSSETKTYDLASGKLAIEYGTEGEPYTLLQEFIQSDDEPFSYGLIATLRA